MNYLYIGFITLVFLALPISIDAQACGDARLAGTVTDRNGDPVTGAEITVFNPVTKSPLIPRTRADGETPLKMLADSNGDFYGAGYDSGDFLVRVKTKKFPVFEHVIYIFECERYVVLRLPEKSGAKGEASAAIRYVDVTDENGKAVVGAKVGIYFPTSKKPIRGYDYRHGRSSEMTCGAGGRCWGLFGLPRGEILLRANAPGFLPTEQKVTLRAAPGDENIFTITLRK